MSTHKENAVIIADLAQIAATAPLLIPLLHNYVSAGFPTPADDTVERSLDLNTHLIQHPAATFFVRAFGDSMTHAGIQSGDILIVDRAIEARHGSIVIAVVNGDFTVKRLEQLNGNWYLIPANPVAEPIALSEEVTASLWGVVIHVIHSFVP